MQVGDLVRYKAGGFIGFAPSEIDRYKGKVGVVIEAKGDPDHLTPYTLFKIHIDGNNLEWFVWHELEVVCK